MLGAAIDADNLRCESEYYYLRDVLSSIDTMENRTVFRVKEVDDSVEKTDNGIE